VSANAPAANTVQLRPQALAVNGSPATLLTDSGPAEIRYQVYTFTGFAPPGFGPVSVVLIGTPSYAGGAWEFKVQ
jgi:hypothetical protein